MIKENRTTLEKIDVLISKNNIEYDFLKLAEETTELSEVLIKMVTKPNRRDERLPHLIEELGDVKLRSEILIRRLGAITLVTDRSIEKLNKLVEDADINKYTSY